MSTTTLETVEAAALSLSLEDQDRLLERLLVLVEPDPAIEAAWIEEAKRRSAAIAAGTATLLPGPETLEKLEAELL
jgi:hypothetical protein